MKPTEMTLSTEASTEQWHPTPGPAEALAEQLAAELRRTRRRYHLTLALDMIIVGLAGYGTAHLLHTLATAL
jgi:hypothetical protein